MTRTEAMIVGHPLGHDRKWTLEIKGQAYGITDYNWELTGYDPRLAVIWPEVFVYGGNAYYIVGAFAKANNILVHEGPR